MYFSADKEDGGRARRLLLMEDESVCLTRRQHQFKSLTGFTAGGAHLLFILLAEVLAFYESAALFQTVSTGRYEDTIGRTQISLI